MDELLNLMEEDGFEGTTEEDVEIDPRIPDPSCRRMTLSPLKHHNIAGSSSPSGSKTEQNVTFKDIFGSPDKRDVKELGLSEKTSISQPHAANSRPAKKFDLASSSQPSSSSSSLLCQSDSQFRLSRAIREDSKVPYKPETGLVVLDPYSRVRLVKSSISIYYDETMTPEAALKDRNLGMEYVQLSSFSVWYRGKGKDQKNFWLSEVLVRKTAGVRKSANGNDYSIWELSDLRDLDKKITVFLFGSASSSSPAAPVGSVIDITTPSVMQDAGGTIKLSVKNSNQLRFIAEAKDFGFCQATKKDGNKCTAVVNTWECSFCIHHASSELASLKQQGVFISDFGSRPSLFGSGGSGGQGGGFNRSFGGRSSQQTVTSRPNLPPSSRMALQGGVNQMNKNPLKFGNPDTVQFFAKGGEQHPLLKQEGDPVPVVKKPLDLNPNKTRHLTDKDRDLLSKLESQATSAGPSDNQVKLQNNKKVKTEPSSAPVVSELITASIVNNPTAATRNFLQFLSLQQAPKDQVDLDSSRKSSIIQPLGMSRAKLRCMEKALDFVKKNGKIEKVDPNAIPGKKRKLNQSQLTSASAGSSSSSSSTSRKRARTQIDVELDFESEDFKKILNAKSAHDEELEQIQHEEYFGNLEKKEALENKLLNTFSINTSAVMCRQCKYVALSQSEFCKELMHQVRLVNARKRFFNCKDCGNRTMSLDRLPKRPCSNCNNSCWLAAPVGRERKGPKLASEMLAIRGHEEKFIGSAGSKVYMHLEV